MKALSLHLAVLQDRLSRRESATGYMSRSRFAVMKSNYKACKHKSDGATISSRKFRCQMQI